MNEEVKTLVEAELTLAEVLVEERKKFLEMVKSFGIFQIGYYDFRLYEDKQVLIRINPDGRCEELKRYLAGWPTGYRFDPNPRLPEFQEIKISGVLRSNHALKATLITKSGMLLIGTVMIVCE